MLQQENLQQKKLLNYTATVGATRFSKHPDSANFIVPPILRTRVPRSWMNFLEESEADLADVVNIVYEGGVSKGVKNGQGKL